MNKVKILGSYKNGNYITTIYDDGTKMRETGRSVLKLIPAFAENCDVKITDKCDGNCPYCYEGCTEEGKHGDILNDTFINSLHPYTELAINGNDLSHPDLGEFLFRLKQRKVIANITVNQKHFLKNIDKLKVLTSKGLVHGIGVSVIDPTDEFIEKVKEFPNAIIHCIAGIITQEQMEKMAEHGLKILILGYKVLGRGHDYCLDNMQELADRMHDLAVHLPSYLNRFAVVSFDNLAIAQLNVAELLTQEEWNRIYMGDDGQYTFYIDLVKGEFARDSISQERWKINGRTVDEMFNVVRGRGEQR